MTFDQIETFLLIVQTNSISKAAEKLYMSQSATGSRLLQLEEELGYKLVNRNKGHRTVALTPEGELFVPIAEKWIALFNESKAVRATRSLPTLRVGGVESILQFVLPGFFQKMLPAGFPYNLSIEVSKSIQAYRALEERSMDLAIVAHHVDFPNIVLEPLITQSFVLLMYSSEPLKMEYASPSDLDSEKEIGLVWGDSYHQWHSYWWPYQGRAPISLSSLTMLPTFLNDEGRWTIVPEGIAQYFSTQPNLRSCYLACKQIFKMFEAVKVYSVNRKIKGLYQDYSIVLIKTVDSFNKSFVTAYKSQSTNKTIQFLLYNLLENN